jgi:hypothetical protein
MDTPTLGIRAPEDDAQAADELPEIRDLGEISHPKSTSEAPPPAWKQDPMPEVAVDWDEFDAGFRAG